MAVSLGRRTGDRLAPDAAPLLSLLRALKDFPEGDALAYAVARGLLAPYRAEILLIYGARSDGHTLDLVGAHGMGLRETRVYQTVTSAMHLPGAECFRTGTEAFMSAYEVATRYPLAAPFFRDLVPRGDIGFLPLVQRGVPIGFLVVTFTERIDRTWQLRAILDAMCDALTLWCVADALRYGDARALVMGAPPLEFTARQREILVGMREGRSTKEIGQSLGFSPATIKADIGALSMLLGAKGRSDLLVKAKQAGL